MRVNDDKDMAPPEMSTDNISIRRQRALYRAEHRGTREMDFLLGRFARGNLKDLDSAELSVFEALLEIPDPVLAGALIDESGDFDGEIANLLERISKFHNNKE